MMFCTFSTICTMMTSSNENIFRVTGPLCGEFTGPGEFPTQRPVTRSFDVFFDMLPNKRFSQQSWGWWFETPSLSLWRHRNDSAPMEYAPVLFVLFATVIFTHWVWSKMTAILQITFKLFVRCPITNNPVLVQIMAYADQMANHYLNQLGIAYWRLSLFLILDELTSLSGLYILNRQGYYTGLLPINLV